MRLSSAIFSFSHFGFIMPTDRQNHRGVSNNNICISALPWVVAVGAEADPEVLARGGELRRHQGVGSGEPPENF